MSASSEYVLNLKRAFKSEGYSKRQQESFLERVTGVKKTLKECTASEIVVAFGVFKMERMFGMELPTEAIREMLKKEEKDGKLAGGGPIIFS